MAKEKWYSAGLCFECTQCGACCSGAPGYVWVTKKEIARIAKLLGRSDEWLDRSHLRRAGMRYSLTEKPNGDCIFLSRVEGRTVCSIYEVRPLQCCTWPFWNANLKSPDAWNQACETCPGINRGQHHDFAQIEAIRTRKPD